MLTASGESLERGDIVVNVDSGHEYRVVHVERGTKTAWLSKIIDSQRSAGAFIAFNPKKHTRKV